MKPSSTQNLFVPRMALRASLNDIDPSVFAGKVVLVRTDYNCPLNYVKRFHWVQDDSKIRASIDTIQFLRNHGAKTVILSHLGRPDTGTETLSLLTQVVDPSYTLRSILYKLDQLLEERHDDSKLLFCNSTIGRERHEMIQSMNNGDVLLLENVRFYKEEVTNHRLFSQALAQDVDIFVNEAFATAHRAHASTFGIKEFLAPYYIAIAGFDFETEVNALESCVSNVKRPAVALIGGFKTSTKLSVLRSLINHVDKVLIGGAVVFTFLKALGFRVGSSFVDDSSIDIALEIHALARKLGVEIILADQFLCYRGTLDEAAEANISSTDLVLHQVTSRDGIPEGLSGYDIGETVVTQFRSHLDQAASIFFNGPMGAFEIKEFKSGTTRMIESILNLTEAKGVMSIVCGGETVTAVEAVTHANALARNTVTAGGHGYKLTSYVDAPVTYCADSLEQGRHLHNSWLRNRNKGFSHLSLGGSAALSLLSNLRLPALEVLSLTSLIPQNMRAIKSRVRSDDSVMKMLAHDSSEEKEERGTIVEK